MRAFYKISLLASSEAKPGEIGARILGEFTRTMEFRRAEIWLLGKDRRLRRLAWHGRVPARVAPEGMPLRRCAFGRVLMRRQGLQYADAGVGPGRRRCHLGWDRMTTLFGAALRGQNGPIGFLFADRGGRAFQMGARDLELAKALAGLIGEVLKSSLNREIEAKRRSDLLLLNKAGRAISSEERLSILLPRLTRMVRLATRAHGAVIALLEEGSREFVVAGVAGPGGARYMGYRFPSRPHRSALSARVLHSGAPVRIDDTARRSFYL